ncbi:hypothetical protein [Amycolatopsis thermoflava]|uniref:hypothetical protein n=1 Tax=Amycolatopsis thermoflava TaxID=84480 RepID=UPI00365E27F3
MAPVSRIAPSSAGFSTPGLPDLNRLITTATWDPVAYRWTRPDHTHHRRRKHPMKTLTSIAGSSADIGLAAGGHWIEQVPAARTRPTRSASSP